MSDAQRARALAYVPQAMDAALDRTALNLVAMGRAPHRSWFAAPSASDLATAREALQRLGIGALAARSYGRMSAGERQLTLIARALAQDARLMILDEPAAHLDLGNQERVLETLAGLAADGRSIVYSSHHPQHAATASRVLLLGRDGIVAHGVPRDVLDAQRLRALYNLRSDRLVSGLTIP
jgi:iron complex transport system ATP-binding protein